MYTARILIAVIVMCYMYFLFTVNICVNNGMHACALDHWPIYEHESKSSPCTCTCIRSAYSIHFAISVHLQYMYMCDSVNFVVKWCFKETRLVKD